MNKYGNSKFTIEKSQGQDYQRNNQIPLSTLSKASLDSNLNYKTL